jgi:antirestriction protein ArdC
VFIVAQCEGLKFTPAPVQTPANGISKPEDIVANMPQRPEIKHGMAHAFYSPREDCVGLPVGELFERTEDYYSKPCLDLVDMIGFEFMPDPSR